MLMDPEAAKEQARKQEFKRAEERLTLKHKNKSKWARRILERGLNAQDEGTRVAMAEQLHHHALLTRKINTVNDSSSSSSDSSSEEDEEGSNEDRASELLEKEKEKTLKELEDDEDLPNSGVLSLSFMVRGMKKERKKQLKKPSLSNWRKTKSDKMKVDNYYGNSDSEDDLEARENFNIEAGRRNDVEKDAGPLYDSTEGADVSVFKNFDNVVGDLDSKTTVSWISWLTGLYAITDEKWEPTAHSQDIEVGEEESDSDSGQQMVAEEFEKDKQEILNEENPEPDKPVLLPGWGQWTDVQKKKRFAVMDA
ncbi:Poly(ADP-ribose) polymerase isoform 1 [Hibiscus syriacus]|uniref:Poly(ADP-ribose) polymerase isoform 1 n=1 Tax=Hibiscus syriacus TaxID=106335 RepID=A0A6A2WPK3_HIBSY|nr:Poly(ADP-ribose) polymerase isoform 1 [Hibiscus syriacus]